MHNTQEGLEARALAPRMCSRYERWWCCGVIIWTWKEGIVIMFYSFHKAVTRVWRGIAEFLYPYGSCVKSDDAVIPSCCCCTNVEGMGVMTKLAESTRIANKAVDELRYLQGVNSSILTTLTTIINQSIKEGQFPTEWKEALVSPILKRVTKTTL